MRSILSIFSFPLSHGLAVHAGQKIFLQIHMVEAGGVDLHMVLDEQLVQPCSLLQTVDSTKDLDVAI